MKTISLSCNHCGAPLEVAESTRFVTCRHCNSRLRIQASGGTAYTEVLEELRDAHREMADDLETIQLQNELERIDREWSDQQRGFETVDKQGRRSLPTQGSKAGMAFGGVVGVVFVIIWISVASSIGAPPIMMLFGALMGAGIIFGVIKGMKAVDQYAVAQRRHDARRRKVLSKLRGRGALHDSES